jgi:hypothetical protein
VTFSSPTRLASLVVLHLLAPVLCGARAVSTSGSVSLLPKAKARGPGSPDLA